LTDETSADAPAGTAGGLGRNERKTVAGPLHTIILLLVIASVSALGYFSVQRAIGTQNPHRLVFYGLTMAWEWATVGYIYWGVRRHGVSFSELVGGSWKGKRFFVDLGIAFAFWVAALVVLGIVAFLLHSRGMNEAARAIAPRTPVESFLWVCVSVTAGICEETIFRGYLQKQFAAWTQNGVVGLVLSALIFGAGHIYQGLKPATVITVYGLMFGTLAEVRRSLRPGMMTHAFHDTAAGLLIRFIPRA